MFLAVLGGCCFHGWLLGALHSYFVRSVHARNIFEVIFCEVKNISKIKFLVQCENLRRTSCRKHAENMQKRADTCRKLAENLQTHAETYRNVQKLKRKCSDVVQKHRRTPWWTRCLSRSYLEGRIQLDWFFELVFLTEFQASVRSKLY